MTSKVHGWPRLAHGLRCSWRGLRAAFRYESAFRQELAVGVVLVPLAIWLAENGIELALMLGCLLLVLITEILNSAIEAVVDLASPEYHELAGRAKDMGSAAVLISIIACPVTWLSLLCF